jgi:hypothetical protein
VIEMYIWLLPNYAEIISLVQSVQALSNKSLKNIERNLGSNKYKVCVAVQTYRPPGAQPGVIHNVVPGIRLALIQS